MGRADIEVPSRGVDGDSRPRRACYPRGNFSVTTNPHQWGLGGSLSPAFASGSLTVEDPVRPAFAFALYGGFLSRLSRPLGPLDIFSRGCRPSQTAHLPLFQRPKAPVRGTAAKGRCSIDASPVPRRGRDRRLPPTLCIRDHAPATGCSKAPRGLLFPLGVRGLFVHVTWVHRVPGGDSGALVDPFVRVGTYPTRHLATLRESELLPAFAGP